MAQLKITFILRSQCLVEWGTLSTLTNIIACLYIKIKWGLRGLFSSFLIINVPQLKFFLFLGNLKVSSCNIQLTIYLNCGIVKSCRCVQTRRGRNKGSMLRKLKLRQGERCTNYQTHWSLMSLPICGKSDAHGRKSLPISWIDFLSVLFILVETENF